MSDDLMNDLLTVTMSECNRCDLDVSDVADRATDEIYRLRERIAKLEAQVCDYSHNKQWIGEKEAPEWCAGCGKHRSFIRDQAWFKKQGVESE